MAEKLGALLVRKRLISQGQLDQALKSQMIYGGRLGTNLIEQELLDIETLGAALAEQRGLPVVSEAEVAAVSHAVISLLPANIAQKREAIPLRLEGRKLKVAMCSP